jgi:hypothetical protein
MSKKYVKYMADNDGEKYLYNGARTLSAPAFTKICK